jgi:DNA replication protein DnaC
MARTVHAHSDLVQRLQIARRELALESALAKLDKYHLLILDDIVYVSKDLAETSCCYRNQCVVRADRKSLRAALHADHRQSAIR